MTLIAPPAELPDWAKQAVNVADPRIGAGIVSCSDDFFAPAARMLEAQAAVFVPGKYDDNGKFHNCIQMIISTITEVNEKVHI